MLGIVILNYNTWDETIECIHSFVNNIRIAYKIYVVDNCSPQKASQEQINALNKCGIELILSSTNSGYAAGNNIGLKKAFEDGCDLFLVSNSDILIEDDSIDKLCFFAEHCNNVGIVGPIIYDSVGKLQPIHMLSKLTAIGKIKNMLLSTPLKPVFSKFKKSFVMHGLPERPLKVFGVSGCCFLITQEGYQKAFPFDEHTFLYEEEYILGCRLEKVGLSAYILPEAHVIHAEAASTEGMGKFSYQCLIDSEQYYLKEYLHESCIMRRAILILRKIMWHLRYKKRNKQRG